MKLVLHILFIMLLTSCMSTKIHHVNSKRLTSSNYFLANSYQVINTNKEIKKHKEKEEKKNRNRNGSNSGKTRPVIDKSKYLTFDFH